MDWVISVMKYAPDFLGIARAATAWVSSSGNADLGTQVVKSVVMLGVKEVAGNCCESGISSGVTVALSSATFDVAASTATGRDYGMVRDFRNGDYLDVGAQGVSDFATGYFLYKGDDKDKESNKRKRSGTENKKKQPRIKQRKIKYGPEPPLGRYDDYPILESIAETEPRLEDVGPSRPVVIVDLRQL